MRLLELLTIRNYNKCLLAPNNHYFIVLPETNKCRNSILSPVRQDLVTEEIHSDSYNRCERERYYAPGFVNPPRCGRAGIYFKKKKLPNSIIESNYDILVSAKH